jgi:hypothetical protein
MKDAGMPMPALLSWMPMHTYGINYTKIFLCISLHYIELFIRVHYVKNYGYRVDS